MLPTLLAAGLSLGVLACATSFGAPQPLQLREGTAFSVTATREGAEVFIDLGGRLWRTGRHGGTAIPLTPPGEIAGRPAVSPDGRRLAYQSLRAGVYQIMLINADGGSARQLTSGNFHHIGPAWAPDGKKLLLATNRTGDFSLWELDLDLLSLSQVTFEPGEEFDPAWAPAGNAYAYAATDGERSRLYVREPFRPPRVLVANATRPRAPAWRPDGSVISFVAESGNGTQLYMVILSDPPVVKPFSPPENVFPFPAAWIDREHFLYTADGRLREREFGAMAAADLPFSATIELPPAPPLPQRPATLLAPPSNARGLRGLATLPAGHLVVAALGNLWEISTAGQLRRQLTSDRFVDAEPAVSSDGRRLAFVSDRDGTPQIWLMELPEGRSRQLTREPAGAGRPAWDPLGNDLAYLARRADGARVADLKIINPATGAMRVLASGLPLEAVPSWPTDGSGVAVLQGNRLSIHPARMPGYVRHQTLLSEAAGSGSVEAQWSADGRSVAVASAAGVSVLPVLPGGIVGAQWRRVTTKPASRVRWLDSDRQLIIAGPEGLFRVNVDSTEVEPAPLPLTIRGARPSGRLVVRAGRVFNGTDAGYQFAQDIVIEGNRIVELRPWSPEPPAAARVLDVRRKTVIPGLIDVGLRLDPPVGERIGRTLLAYGITTVQAQTQAGDELREAAERWLAYRSGPRMFIQVHACGGRMPRQADWEPMTGIWLCPESAAGAIQQGSGADVSIWADSWIHVLTGSAHAIGLPLAELPAHPVLGMRPSVLYQDVIDVTARSGAFFTSGLAVTGLPGLAMREDGRWLAHRQYLALFTPAEREGLERRWRDSVDGAAGSRLVRDQQRSIGQLAAAGGRLAVASGSPATPYGLGFHAELALLQGVGLNPAAVLRLATAEAARLLGLGSHLGKVASGQVADLLVIDGDPLADVTQVLRLEAVILDGEIQPLSDLLNGQGALEKFTLAERSESRKFGH